MIARKHRIATMTFALLALAAAAFWGCQTTDPPPAETILRVHLNDSLARYDRVLVQIVDRNDTSKVLFLLWNAPLKAPATDIPGFNLKNLGAQSFIIKVRAYKALDRLALQTLIFYEPGNKTVRHDTVPKLPSLAYLTSLAPSTGTMAPAFNKDSTRYTVTLPQGINSLTFTATTPLPEVQMTVDASPNPSGTPTKIYQVGSTPDSVWFSVTDTSSGTAVTRDYHVVLVPTPPPGLNLASLIPSYGSFTEPFKPELTLYVFNMAPDKDTISFKATPADTRSMTVTIDNQAVFPGQKSQVITVPKGGNYTVSIEVHRGTDLGYYQVTLDHTQK